MPDCLNRASLCDACAGPSPVFSGAALASLSGRERLHVQHALTATANVWRPGRANRRCTQRTAQNADHSIHMYWQRCGGSVRARRTAQTDRSPVMTATFCSSIWHAACARTRRKDERGGMGGQRNAERPLCVATRCATLAAVLPARHWSRPQQTGTSQSARDWKPIVVTREACPGMCAGRVGAHAPGACVPCQKARVRRRAPPHLPRVTQHVALTSPLM